jgi:hypothetical protein
MSRRPSFLLPRYLHYLYFTGEKLRLGGIRGYAEAWGRVGLALNRHPFGKEIDNPPRRQAPHTHSRTSTERDADPPSLGAHRHLYCCESLSVYQGDIHPSFNSSPARKQADSRMVVHAYNPSYSGGRHRRISSSRPAQAKLVKPYLKEYIFKQKDWT